jgi:hypothetical protein
MTSLDDEGDIPEEQHRPPNYYMYLVRKSEDLQEQMTKEGRDNNLEKGPKSVENKTNSKHKRLPKSTVENRKASKTREETIPQKKETHRPAGTEQQQDATSDDTIPIQEESSDTEKLHATEKTSKKSKDDGKVSVESKSDQKTNLRTGQDKSGNTLENLENSKAKTDSESEEWDTDEE